ncbi:MAG: Ldh family oxidoreductase [Actinomycetota bacterium]|nr:Ldh family oxidoreductase [Actinomycetota bacterium]
MATDTLKAAGLSDTHAVTVADSFVWANLRGIDSHGISRLPRYLELFENGGAAKDPTLTAEKVRDGALLVDANQAPGPVALSFAMQEAIALARTTGVAWATVRGTVHTGAIGYYTSLAADAGMIGIGFVAGVPNMAYHGARGTAVATSPLSIAVPTGDDADFVLDMATATIALGKINQYKARGEALPQGAAVTADGLPTTDPAEAKIPLPVGGPKGSGMSLAFELLTSGLAANPIVSEFHSGTPEGRRHRQNASLIAVDISAFLPLDAFKTIVDETLAAVRGLSPQGDAPVITPGQRAAQTALQRGRDGISLPPKAWRSIQDAAAKYGVAGPVPAS